MAVLRKLLIVVVFLNAVQAHGHHMGRTVPIGYSGEGAVHLVAQVIASYFEEQMGRETELSAESSVEKCMQSILDKKVPMAVLPVVPADRIPEGVVVVLPGIDTGKEVVTLVMGGAARKRLEFSLIPMYLDRLSKGLTPSGWQKGLTRVEAGEGVRGVALDMLREADLL